MIDTLKAHWKYAAAGALMIACFAAGECTRKPPVATTKIEYRDVVKEKIVTQDIVKTVVVHDVVEKVRVVHETVTETRPDGTKVVTQRDTGETTSEKKDTAAASEAKKTVAEREHTTERVETRTVPVLKEQWALSVDGTVSVPALFGGPRASFLPGAPGWLSAGATVSRRVLGPLWVGARADTGGRAGVVLTWTF